MSLLYVNFLAIYKLLIFVGVVMIKFDVLNLLAYLNRIRLKTEIQCNSKFSVK